MKKVKHEIKIGDEAVTVEVIGNEKDGATQLDADDLVRAQREVGLAMILRHKDTKDLMPAHFNFLVNVSGLRGKDLAQYLKVEPGNISQWRREKGISAVAWQAFRMLFFDLFTNGRVTNRILLSNIEDRPEDAA